MNGPPLPLGAARRFYETGRAASANEASTITALGD